MEKKLDIIIKLLKAQHKVNQPGEIPAKFKAPRKLTPKQLLHQKSLDFVNGCKSSGEKRAKKLMSLILSEITQYKFITEKTSMGFSAYYMAPDGSIVATTGDSLENLSSNALEALNLFTKHNDMPLATLDDMIIDLQK